MWISKKKLDEMLDDLACEIRDEFGKKFDDAEGKHKCDVYCRGCKNAIERSNVLYVGGDNISCALDRKCKDFEEEKGE